MNESVVGLYDARFREQIRKRNFALNPIESLVLKYLTGTVLDLGCGLGNLSLEAARRGHRVVAVDAGRTAIERIEAEAQREGLPAQAIETDIDTWEIDRQYDSIVAIGLLMYFQRERALGLLRSIQDHVSPGGRAAINVLALGATSTDMLDDDSCYLFPPDELQEQFAGWQILYLDTDGPEVTVIAERAAQDS